MRARALMTLAAWLVPALASAEAHGAGHVLRFVDVVSGKDSVQFWGAVLNVVFLVVLLYAFAAKPIGVLLSSRRREMEQAIREAAEAKALAQARYDEYAQRLTHLDEELAKLRTDIERAAEQDRERILADAEQASVRLRRDTETLVQQHADALERHVRREVVEAAIATAERVLRETIQTDDQRRLADGYRVDVARTPADRART